MKTGRGHAHALMVDRANLLAAVKPFAASHSPCRAEGFVSKRNWLANRVSVLMVCVSNCGVSEVDRIRLGASHP